MSNQPCIFGEVLYDHFPDGRRVLGGAPFNVAWHLRALGENPVFISRIGADEDGESIRSGMREWGMELAGLQVDDTLPTGRVKVDIIDEEPHYDIVHPAAWDAIETPAAIPDMQLLYHGSLALRADVSRKTCRRLRKSGPSVVFVDVNLRSPWWSRESVLEDIYQADWVKLNQPEFDVLMPGPGSLMARTAAMLEEFELQGLLVTDGSRGADLLTAGGEHVNVRPTGDIKVVDTVGAGDAMASVLVFGILRGWPLGACLERAQEFASAIVGRRGATIQDRGFYTEFIQSWAADGR